MVFVYAKNKDIINKLSFNLIWDDERSCFKTNDNLLTSKQLYELIQMHDNQDIFIFTDITLKGNENKNIDGFIDIDKNLCCLFKTMGHQDFCDLLWKMKKEESNMYEGESPWCK